MKYNLNQVKGLDSGTASGRENVSKSSFSNIEVLVPESLETQQKIASILSAYDDLIENNLRRIKLLEEMAAITYKEWFVNFTVDGQALEIDGETGLPVGWERKNLNEMVDVQYGFAFKAEQFNSEGNGTPIIRIRNIPKSDTNDFTTEIVDKKYLIGKGDLLIGMDGEFYVNNWVGNNAYLVQRVCCVKVKTPSFHGYISEAIKKPIKFYEDTISGATVAHLGKKHLDNIEFIIPDSRHLEKLDRFNIWLNLKINLSTQNRLLKESRDILLPRLMTGAVVV
jgi:type I restriction enzyme S subunit